jgi:hypothetical protein
MEKLEIELWHAYVMNDGEIMICEYMSAAKIIWSWSLNDDYISSIGGIKHIYAIPLGFVGCPKTEARQIFLLAKAA